MNDLRSNAFPKLKRDISHNSFKSISYKPLNKQVIKINNPTNNKKLSESTLQTSSKVDANSIDYAKHLLPNIKLPIFNQPVILTKPKFMSGGKSNFISSNIIEKRLKENIESTIRKQSENNESDNTNDEKEVLNLQFWELDNILDENKIEKDLNTSNHSVISKKNDLESVNYEKEKIRIIGNLIRKGKGQPSFSEKADEGRLAN